MSKKWDDIYMWLNMRRDKLVLIAIVIGSMITVLVGGLLLLAGRAQHELANEVLRFHILANSDAPEDQAVKLLVKDKVIEYLAGELLESNSRQETENMLQARLQDIQWLVLETLREVGCDQTVRVSIGESSFPTKQYGSVSLPAGTYRALRIELGDGAGANWWCMMFPALCFVEEESKSLPEKAEDSLAEQLPEEENELIHQEKAGWGIRIKFKLIEWWAAIFG